MSCLWPVALEGGSGGSSAPPATASVNATADQTTLAAVTLGLTASAAPTAHAWQVNGSTAGISDPTASAPTFTPSQPGQHTVTCTATIDGTAVVATPDTFRVGDAEGWVTYYAPNLAGQAAADWRTGGPGFTTGGKTITTRNAGTFAAGVLGPDGSTGIRFKPSAAADYFSGAATAGGISIALADLIPGLSARTQIDVICAFRVDSDADANYDIISIHVLDGPHTALPRGGSFSRVHDGAKSINAVRRTGGTQTFGAFVGQANPLRGMAIRVSGMTLREAWTESAVSSMPDAAFTGWSASAPWAVDPGNPGSTSSWTVANLTASILTYLAGSAPAGLDVTLTGLWIRARAP